MKVKIDYNEFVLSNQKMLGYKIYKDYRNGMVCIECMKCHSIRPILIKSMYKNIDPGLLERAYGTLDPVYAFHNEFCSKYYINKSMDTVGKDAGRHFHDFYRHAKERCNNPNCKDYERYKGMFKFEDFPDFYINCFDEYLKGMAKWNYKELTIDRIDGSKGYEPGNIRFVDMTTNLQNKSYVIPIKCTNLNTGEVITAVSIGSIAVKMFGHVNYAGAIHRSLVGNSLYRKIYKFEYMPSLSTIEKLR